MSMLLSIILAVVVAGAAVTANRMLDGHYAVWGISAGVCVGIVNYFTPLILDALWLAPIFLVAIFIFSAMLIVWWHQEGSDFKEMVPFLVMSGLFFLVAKAAATVTTILIGDAFWGSVVAILPLLVLIASVGFYFYDWLAFRAEMKDLVTTDEDEDEDAFYEDWPDEDEFYEGESDEDEHAEDEDVKEEDRHEEH